MKGDGTIGVNVDSPYGIMDVKSLVGPHPLGSVFRKYFGGPVSDASHKLALTLWGQDHDDAVSGTGTDQYGPMLGFGARHDDVAPNTGDIRAGISYSYNGDLTFHAKAGGSVSDGSNERLRIDGLAGTVLFANGIQIGVDEGSSTSGGLLIHRYSSTSIDDGVDFDLTITFPHSNTGAYMVECFSGHSHYRGSIMYYKVVGMYGASTSSSGGVDMTAVQETNTNNISFSDTSNATQRSNGSNYSVTITARSGLSNTGTSLDSHVHVYVHSRVAPVSVTIS